VIDDFAREGLDIEIDTLRAITRDWHLTRCDDPSQRRAARYQSRPRDSRC